MKITLAERMIIIHALHRERRFWDSHCRRVDVVGEDLDRAEMEMDAVQALIDKMNSFHRLSMNGTENQLYEKASHGT